VDVGDLVITELRGPKSTSDTYGHWIELLNTTDAEVNLYGLRIRMKDTSGVDAADPHVALVRNELLSVEAHGYIVLGLQYDDALPEHVDYGYRVSDNTQDLPNAARITVSTCDVDVDEVIYAGPLEFDGSLAFDGALEPTAEANDNQASFCRDESDAPVGAAVGVGKPGTPGEPNNPCP